MTVLPDFQCHVSSIIYYSEISGLFSSALNTLPRLAQIPGISYSNSLHELILPRLAQIPGISYSNSLHELILPRLAQIPGISYSNSLHGSQPDLCFWSIDDDAEAVSADSRKYSVGHVHSYGITNVTSNHTTATSP